MIPIKFRSELINFAVPKTRHLSGGILPPENAAPGKSAKKKCTKGTACGGSCISANKTCKKKQSVDGSNKTKALIASLKGKGQTSLPQEKSSTEITTGTSGGPTAQTEKSSSYGENFRKAKKDPNIDEVTIDEFVDLYAGKYYEFSGNGRATVDITKRKDVERAIRDGIYIEDAAIDAHPTLKKKYAIGIAQTNKDNDRWQEINRRVNAPILSADETKNYKPFMSADEAASYTSDSFFSGVDMFHGTSAKGAESIVNEGVNIDFGRRGLYGEGFYMGVEENIAKGYTAEHKRYGGGDGSVVTTRVKAKNPFRGDINGELRDKLAGSGLSEITGKDGSDIKMFLKANGYDSIYQKDSGYLVALENKQVVTYQNKKVTETADELTAMMLNDSTTKNNKNYKLLSEIK
ncbi:hypothetical protein [Chroococcidiopsis sp.]|uniref:hypothetical protein n=1 Tax=Chroococcidiopsis sp. TaxID=3088168 RepID=UPI003F346134